MLRVLGRFISRPLNIVIRQTMETKENQLVEETLAKKRKLSGAGDVQGAGVRFTKIHPDAQTPSYGSEGAVGADVYSVEDCTVPAKSKLLIHTGLKLAVPIGYYARVAPRSGLAVKHFIDVGAGVIDPDYRGEINVLLFNFNDSDFEVKKGDRIAQIVFEKCERLPLIECESLDKTTRGEAGFGSTGVGLRAPLTELAGGSYETFVSQ